MKVGKNVFARAGFQFDVKKVFTVELLKNIVSKFHVSLSKLHFKKNKIFYFIKNATN